MPGSLHNQIRYTMWNDVSVNTGNCNYPLIVLLLFSTQYKRRRALLQASTRHFISLQFGVEARRARCNQVQPVSKSRTRYELITFKRTPNIFRLTYSLPSPPAARLQEQQHHNSHHSDPDSPHLQCRSASRWSRRWRSIPSPRPVSSIRDRSNPSPQATAVQQTCSFQTGSLWSSWRPISSHQRGRSRPRASRGYWCPRRGAGWCARGRRGRGCCFHHGRRSRHEEAGGHLRRTGREL